jgi:predicted GNAT family acetyltransferase
MPGTGEAVRKEAAVLRTASVRRLRHGELRDALALADRDPVTNVFVASRLTAAGLTAARLGADVWAYDVDGRLESLCYVGANLVPVEATPDAIGAFAARALREGRRCSSIVGPVDVVSPLWAQLEDTWGPARDVRRRQPLMVALQPSARVGPDPAVRRVRPDEYNALLPACVAMFTEEVGVSPIASDGGALYRARVRELIATGRSLARIEDGRVIFKAEIGAVTAQACQIQGVWVAPDRRGEGLSKTGMAAVVEIALREFAPRVSLYVNDFNLPALAAYRQVGFTEIGAFMSVLF